MNTKLLFVILVLSLANNALAVLDPDANMLIYYNLDNNVENGGSLGSDGDGTMTGFDGGDFIASQAGFVNGLDFDGTNDWVNIGDTKVTNFHNRTIAFWLKKTDPTETKAYVFGTSSDYRIYILLRDTGTIEGNLDVKEDAIGQTPISDDTWYHIAFVIRDSGANCYGDFYIDGDYKGTSAGARAQHSGSLTGVNLGSFQDGLQQFLDGVIDDFRIYSYALNATEVNELYEYNLPPAVTARNPNPSKGATGVATDSNLSWIPGDYTQDVNAHDVYLGTDYSEVDGANTSDITGIYRDSQNLDVNFYHPEILQITQIYYWRIDEVNQAGPDPCFWKGNIWNFTVEHVGIADEATPYNLQPDVSPISDLSWSPGKHAATHDVYLGTNFGNVNSANTSDVTGIYRDDHSPAGSNSYDPCGLDMEQIYYWRIDEVNGTDTTKGNVWTFTVADYILVDDFESYPNDVTLAAIWDANDETSAAVSLKTGGFHDWSGYQSMKIDYNNTQDPCYAQVELTYQTAQDWTTAGVRALYLEFEGSGDNSAEQMYVALEDTDGNSAVVIYDEPNDLIQPDWALWPQQWNIDLQDFNSAGVDPANIRKIAIGFGDRNNPQTGGSGSVYFDNIRLYRPRCVFENRNPADITGDCVVDGKDLDKISYHWLLSGGNVTATEPNNDRLVVYYDFNETSSFTAYDSSSNGFNATVDTNDAWEVSGKYNGCIYFNGDPNSAASVSVPSGAFSGINNQITISMWLNTDVNGAEHMLLFDSNSSGDGDLWPESQWGDFSFAAGPNGLPWSDSKPQDYKDLWHHYALVKDAGEGMQKIYRDGELVAQDLESFESIAGGDIDSFTIGSHFSGTTRYGYWRMYKGRLDEFRIYDYALSQAEVLTLAELSQFDQPVLSQADIYEDSDEIINSSDFGRMAEMWLEGSLLWPGP